MVLIENPVRTSGSAPPRAVGRWATSCRNPRNGISDYWRRSGSFAGGSWAPRMLVTTMPMVNTGAGANCGAEVVWWPGRPDPGCGQCGRVPLGLQPVDAHHQVARGPGPGQTATERGGAQQADTGHPGQVGQHVQGAAGQLRSGPGARQRACCGKQSARTQRPAAGTAATGRCSVLTRRSGLRW